MLKTLLLFRIKLRNNVSFCISILYSFLWCLNDCKYSFALQEAEALSLAKNFNTKDIKEIAIKIYNFPKQNEARSRIVVITQGIHPVILVKDGEITEYPVQELPKEKIVDTNGAGDAFAGGFMSQYIQGKDLGSCVKCGNWAASQIIQRSGCTFEGKPSFEV